MGHVSKWDGIIYSNGFFLIQDLIVMVAVTKLELTNVLRDANTNVDFLAKYANKHLQGITFWDTPPVMIEELLAADALCS